MAEKTKKSGASGDYSVGYCRPPENTRFKRGQSGNIRGRPAGRLNFKTTVERLLSEKVAVQKGNKTRFRTKFEALLDTHMAQGIDGDHRSAGVVFNYVSYTGLLGDQEEGASESTARGVADAFIKGIRPGSLSREDAVELAKLCQVLDKCGDLPSMHPRQRKRFLELIGKASSEVIEIEKQIVEPQPDRLGALLPPDPADETKD